MAPSQIMNRIRDPLRADFDDADAQLRKSLRNTFVDKRMERTDHGELELAKAGFIEKKLVRLDAAVCRVNANREVELARGFVQRIEIGITETPVGFEAPEINAAGAMLFTKLQFLEHTLHVEQRRHHHPVKTIRRLFDDVRHPAVVAAAQSEVDFGPPCRREDKNRRIDHL